MRWITTLFRRERWERIPKHDVPSRIRAQFEEWIETYGKEHGIVDETKIFVGIRQTYKVYCDQTSSHTFREVWWRRR